jgi:hypothetical protein
MTVGPNPVFVYDRETGEPIRPATAHEEGCHFQFETRDAPPLRGDDLGIPGRTVWLARLDPRRTILSWTPDMHPIFVGWKYRGWEFRRGRAARQVCFSAAEALAFSRDTYDRDGRADGAPYGAPGATVVVDYRQDLGLPPGPILERWLTLFWGPNGETLDVSPTRVYNLDTEGYSTGAREGRSCRS